MYKTVNETVPNYLSKKFIPTSMVREHNFSLIINLLQLNPLLNLTPKIVRICIYIVYLHAIAVNL